MAVVFHGSIDYRDSARHSNRRTELPFLNALQPGLDLFQADLVNGFLLAKLNAYSSESL
jgi:hypothetical protein